MLHLPQCLSASSSSSSSSSSAAAADVGPDAAANVGPGHLRVQRIARGQ